MQTSRKIQLGKENNYYGRHTNVPVATDPRVAGFIASLLVGISAHVAMDVIRSCDSFMFCNNYPSLFCCNNYYYARSYIRHTRWTRKAFTLVCQSPLLLLTTKNKSLHYSA